MALSLSRRSMRTAVTLVGVSGALAFAFHRAGPSEAFARSTLEQVTVPVEELPELTTLVDENTALAIDLYKAIGADRAGQNVFFSPYSISVVLAMVYAGASGETASEIETVIHTSLSAERMHRAFGALDFQLSSRAPFLAKASAIWASSSVQIETSFLDLLATNYGAGVGIADFARDPGGSRRRINDWVADRTDNKIREAVDAQATAQPTPVALVNVAAFEGHWREPFDQASTSPEPFTCLDGTSIEVPTMRGKPWARFAKTKSYDAVELGYAGGKIVMDLAMPKAGTFADFESGLTGPGFVAILQGLQSGEVDLWMPRFEFSGGPTHLKPTLQALGMKRAFDRNLADFSNMGKDKSGPLYLGDVFHQATVSVDEFGTRAYAETFAGNQVGAHGAPQIHIDHPFVFVLRDVPTGTILFAGRLAIPSRGRAARL